MSSAATVSRSDRELVNALRAFPKDVLPVGLLRELAARGPAVQDESPADLSAPASSTGASKRARDVCRLTLLCCSRFTPTFRRSRCFAIQQPGSDVCRIAHVGRTEVAKPAGTA